MRIKHFIFAIVLAAGVFSYSNLDAFYSTSRLYEAARETLQRTSALTCCAGVYDALMEMEECPADRECIPFDVTLSRHGSNCLMTMTSDFDVENARDVTLIDFDRNRSGRPWNPEGAFITVTTDSTVILSIPITHDILTQLDLFDYLSLRANGLIKRISFTTIRNAARDGEGASGGSAGGSDPADEVPAAGSPDPSVAPPPADDTAPPAETPVVMTPADALPGDNQPPDGPIAPPDSSLLYDDGSCSLLGGSASSFGKLILGVLFALTLIPMTICRKK